MMAQLRLYLGFGILIAFLGLGGVAFWYRGQAISAAADAAQARADRDTAVAANKAQEETIGRLRADAAANDRILARMADDIAGINSNTAETNQQIGELKDANEDVRAYLGAAVPADLKRLLDR
jgi:LysB family phage lysis regulatory protein